MRRASRAILLLNLSPLRCGQNTHLTSHQIFFKLVIFSKIVFEFFIGHIHVELIDTRRAGKSTPNLIYWRVLLGELILFSFPKVLNIRNSDVWVQAPARRAWRACRARIIHFISCLDNHIWVARWCSGKGLCFVINRFTGQNPDHYPCIDPSLLTLT